jgi:hypothetical protein
MHWNVSIGPDKWPIFGRFLTLFPLKRPTRREKIPPIWRTSVDDVTASPSIEWHTLFTGNFPHDSEGKNAGYDFTKGHLFLYPLFLCTNDFAFAINMNTTGQLIHQQLYSQVLGVVDITITDSMGEVFGDILLEIFLKKN